MKMYQTSSNTFIGCIALKDFRENFYSLVILILLSGIKSVGCQKLSGEEWMNRHSIEDF